MKALILVALMTVNSITAANVLYSETFDDFLGSGLQPGGGSGTLNSNQWRLSGLSDGDTHFGDHNNQGDSARGQSSGAVRSGGLYGFDIAGNPALGWQATGSDLTPGGFYLQIPNSSQTVWNNLRFSFELWYFNDQPRSTRVDLVTYADSNPLRRRATFNTSQAAESTPYWQFKRFNIDLGDYFIPAGGLGLFEWQLADASGQGARDELAIDNLLLTRSNPALSVDERTTTLMFCGFGFVLLMVIGNRRTLGTAKLTTLNTADIWG
jgi:hypothetical protein